MWDLPLLPPPRQSRVVWELQTRWAKEEKKRWEIAQKTGNFEDIEDLMPIFVIRARSWVKYHRREHDENRALWLTHIKKVLLAIINDMNKSIPPDEPSYGEVDADHIIYAFFQMYTYTEDDEITPDDQENRRYLEKIGAWVCTGPTGLERGMQEMKVNDPVGSSSS